MAGLASDGRSVERAGQAAGLDPSTVGLVEAHGTGTPAGDAAEIATLRQVFDPYGDGHGGQVALGSVTSMIGHAMPASGIAGLIKSSLAVFHQVVPPTLHCEDPHPDLAGSRFVRVGEARDWQRNGHPLRAGVNAFGFGGINAHVVLEEHGRSAGSMRGSPPSRSAKRQVPVGRHVSGGAHAPRVTGIRVSPERMFLATAERPEDLLTQLDDEASVLAGSSLLDVGAGGPLRLAIADATPQRIALARTVVARGAPWRGRNDVWFSPSGLIAHGGKVAFAFPGVEPISQGPGETHVRSDHRAAPPAPGSSVAGPLGPRLRELRRGGPELDDVAAVPHRLPHADVRRLPPPFQKCLGGLPLTAPRIPMWSSITAQPFPTDRPGIRDVATRLYTEPVRFRELVENLYAEGVRVFLQPGLGGVTGFVDDTLHGQEHLAIAAAVPNRSGLAQLARVAAALWVEGADVHFEQLVAPTLTPYTPVSSHTVIRLDQPLIRGGSRTLRHVADAERDVMEAITHAAQGSLPGPTEVASTHPVPPTSVRAGTPPGRPASESTQRRIFSLDAVPEPVDHAFFRQPDGVGTVPLTRLLGSYWGQWIPAQLLHFLTIGNLEHLLAERGSEVVRRERGTAQVLGADFAWAVYLVVQKLAPPTHFPWQTRATRAAKLRRAIGFAIAVLFMPLALGGDLLLSLIARVTDRGNAYRVVARKTR